MSNGKLRKRYIRCFFNGDHVNAIRLIIKHTWLSCINVGHCKSVLEMHIDRAEDDVIYVIFTNKITKREHKYVLEIHEKKK